MRITITLCLLFVLFFSCKKKNASAKEFDYGTISSSTYTNEYFDFSIEIPTDWDIQSNDAVEQLQEIGEELLEESDGHNHHHQDHRPEQDFDSDIKNLLVAYQYKVGSNSIDYNSNISIIAERISDNREKLSAREFLDVSRQLLLDSNMEVSDIEQKKIELDGKEFEQMEVRMNLLGTVVTQNFYVKEINDFFLIIVASHDTDEQEATLTEILDSITFA